MYIVINGKQVSVSITQNGLFYDTKEKKHYCSTLAGLREKMATCLLPADKQYNIQNKSGRLGKVIGKTSEAQYFAVKWDSSNKTSTEHITDLYVRLSDMDKEHVKQLDENIAEAQAACDEVQRILDQRSNEVDLAEEAVEDFMDERSAKTAIQELFSTRKKKK